MSTSNGSKLCLKVVMNEQKSKVLFAEANSDVVDVLLSFLTLPLGKIVTILEKHYGGEAPVIGSISSLYRGLVNLDSSHFRVPGSKQMLLNPICYFQRRWSRLKLDVSDSKRRKVYYCENSECPKPAATNVCLFSDIAMCDCGKPLNSQDLVMERPVNDGDDGVFMMKAASFVICDDLRVVPVVSAFVQTLTNLGITGTAGAEMTNLSIGIDDVLDLLKYSLISSTPLSDLVIKKISNNAAKRKRALALYQIQTGDAQSRNKMFLKVFLQNSTNKFLLAVATDEFVEFLFSFLVVSLGGVEHLLGGKTCFKNFDNLYKSVTDVIDDKYFRSPHDKNRLMNPKLPHGYISKNQFLPLTEEDAPHLTRYGKPLSFKSTKGDGSFLREETMYIVSDDLTVTPFSLTSGFLIPSSLGISLSDVREEDLHVGVEEALSILQASLSSTTPLTDVLLNINPMSKKVPKREP